jgi:hypothetical protein
MISKVQIEPYTRILIDRWYESPDGHPGILDLMPAGGSLDEKFSLNRLGVRDLNKTGVLCPRISRVNHACLANSHHFTDMLTKTKILYSTSRIWPGDEICVSYSICHDPIRMFPLEDNPLSKWGFNCDPDCLRFTNPEILREIIRLDEMISSAGDRVLEYVDRLFEIHRMNKAGLRCLGRTLLDGFQFTAGVYDGLFYLEEWCRIHSSVANPKDLDLIEKTGVLEELREASRELKRIKGQSLILQGAFLVR